MTKKKILKVGLKFKKRKMYVDAVESLGILGLMFQKRENAKALLFDFSDREKLTMHSLFVFFPFLALWLDDKNKVLEIKIVKPFSIHISSKKPFSRIVEIPLNQKYKKIIEKLVGRERFK